MIEAVHPVAGTLALVMIVTFWLATVVSELAGNVALVVTVKTAIPWGFLLLIPALAAAGGTGMKLGGRARGGLVGAKRRRMPLIAANGLLVLVPSALFLAARAASGTFDTAFYAVQAVELVAGAANIVLLGRNMRDGLRMSNARRQRSRA